MTKDNLPVPHNEKGDVHLVARTPMEMAQAQEQLIKWSLGKLGMERSNAEDIRENLAIAKKNKWKQAPWKRRLKLSLAKIILYEKLHQALKAGYYIVPPFTAQVFAVRRDKPGTGWASKRKQYHGKPGRGDLIPAQELAVGEGDFVSPDLVWKLWNTYEQENTYGNKEKIKHWISKAYQEIDFPMRLVKPQILEATAQAMQEKIFDQIGILPPRTRNADPIVVGQILRDGKEPLTFFIGWWLNTEDL